jgi:hypothetical protein
MKRILILLALIVVGVTSAEAQTKEFLEQFNAMQIKVDGAEKLTGIEVLQTPGELLRTLTPKEKRYDNNNLLGRIKMIYQIKLTLPQNQQWYQTIYDATVVSGGEHLYRQCTRVAQGDNVVLVYEAVSKHNGPIEFLIFIKGKDKASIFDIVGYINLQDIVAMLSPELRHNAVIDSLNISNK